VSAKADAERPRIAENLAVLAVPIDSVQPSPRNPREGDVGAISESLKRFGQQKPIVVQASSRNVVAGNHLYRAAQALEWTEIAANVVEMSDREAKAFMIADNRTADLGTYDQAELASMLRELSVEDDLAGTGYDGEDVDELLKHLEWKSDGGNPIIQYSLIFDNEAQQDAWTTWLRSLRKRYPDDVAQTHAYRIARFLAEQE
jgi:hypothetical protein